MRLEKANNQRKMPTQRERFTVKVSAGIATRSKAGKVESMEDESKVLEQESTTQPNESEDGCKSKSEIDDSRVSANGSSADFGVQAERNQAVA